MNHPKNSRRAFIKGTAGLVAAGGVGSFVPKLNLIGEALAQSAVGGYKALVCIYLGGGSDSFNMLIPTGTTLGNEFDHTVYRTSRGLYYSTVNDPVTFKSPDGLGIPRATTANCLPQAIALTSGVAAGGNLGLNPFMPGIANLYNQGRVAFLANVGTLYEPLTRATYNNRRKPPQLYSHNDQTNLWQIGSSVSSTTQRGFGGMIAGITANPSPLGLSSAISVAGSNRFLIGRTLADQAVFPFQLSTSATTPATTLSNYNPNSSTAGEAARRSTLDALINETYPELFSKEHGDIFGRSLTLSTNINGTISDAVGNAALYVPNSNPNANIRGNAVGNNVNFPNTGLAQQLRQIARVIRVSRPGYTPTQAGLTPINANRQVFYATAGGWDTHSGQITSISAAQGQHLLLQQLSEAINWFYAELTAMGPATAGGIDAVDQVIGFTQSDFARTINGNDNGTDHSWGGVQMAFGGPAAITGGQVYGRYPSMKLDNRIGGTGAVVPDRGECFSRGQFIPTLAVDQMSASFARWMGVDNSNLPLIFPNIDNFATGPFANAGASPTFAYFNRVVPNLCTGIT